MSVILVSWEADARGLGAEGHRKYNVKKTLEGSVVRPAAHLIEIKADHLTHVGSF